MEAKQKTIRDLEKEFIGLLEPYSADYFISQYIMCGNKKIIGAHITIHLPYLPAPTKKTITELKDVVEKYFGKVGRIVVGKEKTSGCSKLSIYRSIEFEFAQE
jgi:hypothetical protein